MDMYLTVTLAGCFYTFTLTEQAHTSI